MRSARIARLASALALILASPTPASSEAPVELIPVAAVRVWCSPDGSTVLVEKPPDDPPPRLVAVAAPPSHRFLPALRFEWPPWASGALGKMPDEAARLTPPSWAGGARFATGVWNLADDQRVPMPIWLCDPESGRCRPLPLTARWEEEGRFTAYYARPQVRGESLFFSVHTSEAPARLGRVPVAGGSSEELAKSLSGELSPDGKRVATATRVGKKGLPRLRLVLLAGGATRDLGACPGLLAIAFAPDGLRLAVTRLVSADESALFVVGTGAKPRWIEIARTRRSDGEAGVAALRAGSHASFWPVWAADGKALFYSTSTGAVPPRIHRWDVASGASRAISPDGQAAWSPAPSPDGKRLYWVARVGESSRPVYLPLP